MVHFARGQTIAPHEKPEQSTLLIWLSYNNSKMSWGQYPQHWYRVLLVERSRFTDGPVNPTSGHVWRFYTVFSAS